MHKKTNAAIFESDTRDDQTAPIRRRSAVILLEDEPALARVLLGDETLCASDADWLRLRLGHGDWHHRDWDRLLEIAGGAGLNAATLDDDDDDDDDDADTDGDSEPS